MQGRRQILKAGLAGAAVAVPAVASAQQTFNWKMTSAYGKGAPFYMDGPGLGHRPGQAHPRDVERAAEHPGLRRR